MTRNWTKEQQQAITCKPNILVNAAAGSGKTAVLVERIIQKLIPDEQGSFTDITRLLVVTFARDAAGEMQERIKKTLTEYMLTAKKEELARHFKNQLKLVSQSDITTIDSFCIKAVRNNFHLLGIDPTFGIMDETEAKLMKLELADDLFESLYAENNEDFIMLSKLYSGIGDDYGLIKIINDIYEFTRSLPDPNEWLVRCAESYTVPFSGSVWESGAVAEKNKSIDAARNLLLSAKNRLESYAEENGFSFDETDAVYMSVQNGLSLCKALSTSGFDETVDLISSIPSVPSKSRKKDELSVFKNSVSDVIVKAYEIIKNLCPLFSAKSNEQDRIMKSQYAVIKALTELCIRFSDAVFEAKQDKNLYEFNDIEHMCLNLFLKYPDICEEYKNKYDEILMDEYQDTNALQEAVFSAISKENNRFMVGDMKQSIYRFRSSDPAIFKAKDTAYRGNPQLGTLISLTKNFRSRSEVLDSVNRIFEEIMREDTAEIDYDSSQRLNCGNSTFEDNKYKPDMYISEFHIVEMPEQASSDDDDDTNAIASEARYIGQQIRSFIDSGYKVFDGKTFRNAKYSDIAVLSSAVKSISADYTKIFNEMGIPASIYGGNLFERSEIRLVCCLMSIICNPLRDISLLCVLRSPIFAFTENELAEIRVCSDGNFYKAMKKYSQLHADSKCSEFIDRLSEWRELSKHTNSYKLLWTIFSHTGLYDIAGIIYDEDACANLRLLTEMAKTYEKNGYKGLYNFSSYIERLRKNNVVIESVSSRSASDCVRIMTIHKSKGLEFPIVFLAGASRGFVNDRHSSLLSMHKDYGIALQYLNYDTKKLADTVWQLIMNKIKSAEEKAESMRKLYVALTRPKEKLIITAASKAVKYDKNGDCKSGGAQEMINSWNNFSNDSYKIMNAKCYADWVGPIVMKERSQDAPLWKLVISEASKAESTDSGNDSEKEYTDYITAEAIDSILSREYPFSGETDIPSRMYVTQLKNPGNTEHVYDLKKEPDFIKSTAISGAKIGNAYHMILSVINTDCVSDIECVQAEIERIHQCGYITDAEKALIKPEKLLAFFESDFGCRLKNADLHRETPFEIMVPSSDIFPDTEGEILIQGIIDCWFYDDSDNIVLIDYKTDNVKELSELTDRYKTQLIWYKRALEQILKKPVSECYIYSLSKERAVLI